MCSIKSEMEEIENFIARIFGRTKKQLFSKLLKKQYPNRVTGKHAVLFFLFFRTLHLRKWNTYIWKTSVARRDGFEDRCCTSPRRKIRIENSAIFHYSPVKSVYTACKRFLKPIRLFVDHCPRGSARLTALPCLLTRAHAPKTTRVFAPTTRTIVCQFNGSSSGAEVAAINVRYSIPPARAKTMQVHPRRD